MADLSRRSLPEVAPRDRAEVAPDVGGLGAFEVHSRTDVERRTVVALVCGPVADQEDRLVRRLTVLLRDGVERLDVDLAAAEGVDVRVAGCLLAVRRWLDDRGGVLRIVRLPYRVSPTVARALLEPDVLTTPEGLLGARRRPT